MNIRAIRNDDDLAWAVGEIEPYFMNTPARGSPEAERFDVLAELIEAYENKRYPIPKADPVDVLHFAIDSMGRSQVELSRLLGSRSRASEILRRRRHMTLEQIRLVSEAWHLPIASLTDEYELQREYA